MTFDEINKKIKQWSIVDKFIYINLLIFIATVIITSFNHFQNQNPNHFIIKYLALNVESNAYIYKLYTFITYGFVHTGFIHFIINMIGLYYIGHLFLDYFSTKEFIIYYVLGSIFGGLFFLAAYHYFPVFNGMSGIIIGASASVLSILIGLATKMPTYEVHLRLIGYVKLWVIAAVFILFHVLITQKGNEGGQISHLGGVFIGFILARYYNTSPRKKSRKRKQTHLKTVYKKQSIKINEAGHGLSNHQKSVLQQRKIDMLLDKISKSGYESLSSEEREFLDSANK
jgi:membrane associated rhomboid family serine protease